MRCATWVDSLRRAGAVLGLLLIVGLPVDARAEDVLVLANGRKAEGRIVEETTERIRLEVGGGSMWYPRSMVKEIIRDETPVETPAEQPATVSSRDEYGLLYRDGVRVGVRLFRTIERADSIQFEEERVFFANDDGPARTERRVERCDRQFRPEFLQIRTGGPDGHVLLEARVRAGQLVRSGMVKGRRELATTPLPTGARFPAALREHFAREHAAMDGRFSGLVYDLAGARWLPVVYEDRGPKKVESTDGGLNPELHDVRVFARTVGTTTEVEWFTEDRTVRMAELDGTALRFLPAAKDTVERLRKGDSPPDDALSGTDGKARVRHEDPQSGWSIEKPDPSWAFEAPDVEGSGALLSVRNGPLAATIDLQLDPTRREKVTVEAAVESVQRVLRAVAPDLSIQSERYTEGPYGREYWFEAKATTKGEKTRTLGRIVVRGERAFRLLGACPERWFDLCKPDFESVLRSFRLDR